MTFYVLCAISVHRKRQTFKFCTHPLLCRVPWLIWAAFAMRRSALANNVDSPVLVAMNDEQSRNYKPPLKVARESEILINFYLVTVSV